MKIKYALLAACAVLFLISLSQIFPVWPSAKKMYPLYRSGYFVELDRQYESLRDAFTGIMKYGKPDHAWLFLDEMQKKQGLVINVYTAHGELVRVPGEKVKGSDAVVQKMVLSMNASAEQMVRGNRYYAALPVRLDASCAICHNGSAKGALAGVITFERHFDATIYYSAERKIIFTAAALAILALMVLVLFWDPDRRIKELFDK